MDFVLEPLEVRVLGALMEKEVTTPEYYPLTLNSLVAACNQRSNREPVLVVQEEEVQDALERLRERGLIRDVSGAGHRVHKYGHRAGEAFNFDRREHALLCVLMLRGPQTVGELRGRTERMYAFDDLESVEAALGRLAERTPPLVVRLPRRPGEKESRYAHLLGGEVEVTPGAPQPVGAARLGPEERISRLEEEVANLRRQFEEFRRSFE